MTDELRACPHCQQLVGPGTTVCPSCKSRIDWAELWPTWHGAPTTASDPEQDWGSAEATTTEEEFAALSLDPSLVDARIHRPGKRGGVVLLVAGAVAWFFVSRLYHDGNPAAIWDYIWYVLAITTLGLGVWLLIALVGRARTHGLGPALRWLVS